MRSVTTAAFGGLLLLISGMALASPEPIPRLADRQHAWPCAAPLEGHLCELTERGMVVHAVAARAIGEPPAREPAREAKFGAGTLLSPVRCEAPLESYFCALDGDAVVVLATPDAGRPDAARPAPLKAPSSGPAWPAQPKRCEAPLEDHFCAAGPLGNVVLFSADTPIGSPTASTAPAGGPPPDTPFQISILSQSDTSRPFEAGNYAADGQFTIDVADGSCTGTYTVQASPVAGSAPDGSNPPFTTITAYIGFGQGNFLFANAGAGQYEVTVTQTNPACTFDPGVNPASLTVTIDQAPNDTPFTASIFSQADTSRPFAAGNYTPNGQFTIDVADGNCAGTYTVQASPVAGSAPDGSNPPFTTITAYIGFGQGNFLFANAGAGQYDVTVTQTDADCVFDPGVNPAQLTVTIGQGPNDTPFVVTSTQTPTSLPFLDPAYAANGSFTMAVADGNCTGTYTVQASPVAGSAPDGSNPPFTTITAYIGFGQGNFLFANAGIGQYDVTVTQTDADCAFDPGVNPFSTVITIVGATPQSVLTPPSIDFGDVTVGADSAIVEVTLTNAGDSSLFVSSVSDPGAPFAGVGGTCGAAPFSLPVGGSCTLAFRFSPSAPGSVSAVVNIESTAPSSPDSISLTGTGVSPLPPPVSVPTLGRIGLGVLVLMLTLLAGWQIRRFA
jgi:hypothetical protein